MAIYRISLDVLEHLDACRPGRRLFATKFGPGEHLLQVDDTLHALAYPVQRESCDCAQRVRAGLLTDEQAEASCPTFAAQMVAWLCRRAHEGSLDRFLESAQGQPAGVLEQLG
jgi:hypothetical protein